MSVMNHKVINGIIGNYVALLLEDIYNCLRKDNLYV